MKQETSNEKETKTGFSKAIDLPMIIGLVTFVIYQFVNRFFVTVPDVIAYPWMILSCGCMLVGVYRTGKKLGSYHK